MRRWQWKEFRAETFTHFYDLEREGAWSDLGPTGTLRVKEAWVGGAPVGSTFFMTQDTMVSVKVSLLAVLPQGAIFCRTTMPDIWVAVREKPAPYMPRTIVNLDVHAQEIDEWRCEFTTMNGTLLASAVLKDGDTIEDAVAEVDHLMPDGPLKLIVGLIEVTPRNVKSKVGGKMEDSWDEPPIPRCLGGYGSHQGITEVLKRIKNKDFSCPTQLVNGNTVEKKKTKAGGNTKRKDKKPRVKDTKKKNKTSQVKDKVKKHTVDKKKSSMKRPSSK